MGLYIYFCAVCATFSGFSYGYDAGSLSGVKDMMGYRNMLNLSYNSQSGGDNSSQSCNLEDDVETSSILGLITALFSVGGVVGALCGGPLSDRIGRKPVLILGGGLVGIGGLVHSAAVHLAMVLIGRLLGGFGTGIMYTVTPMFVGEIVSEHLRGRFLTVLTFFAVSGYTLAIILSIFLQHILYGWRIILSIQGLGGIIVALGMVFAPRSPRWLIHHGNEAKARKVLHYIYKNSSEVESHLQKIKMQTSDTRSFSSTLKFICQWKIFQRVLLGFFIILLGRFTGGSFLGYFSVSIFCKIGLPGVIASLSLGTVGIVTLIVSVIIIDKFGRKSIFLAGITIMIFGLIISAVLIKVYKLENLSNQDERDSRSIVIGYITLIIVCIYASGFNVSVSNIPWIMMGELFPLPAKGLVTAICNSAFWIGMVIGNQVGPILLSTPLRLSGTLLLFSANAILLFVIVLFFMPETKEISLEDIEKLYLMPWKDRVHILYYLRCCCFVEPCRRKIDREHFDGTKEPDLTSRIIEEEDTVSLSSTISDENSDIKLETLL